MPVSRPALTRVRITVVLALALGLTLFVLHALTKAPHVDEGDLASAGLSLLNTGHSAFPMSYYYKPGFRSEYLAPPFYYATLAGWFAVFGTSLTAYRLFHACSWFLVVACCAQLSARVSRVKSAAVIAAVLLALNYDLINLGISRYDIVCAGLNTAAVAAYIGWRATRFTLAVVAANACLALSAITHPNALVGLVGWVMLVVGSGDWRRVRLRHAVLGALPYVVAFGLWALMIDGRWSMFVAQMSDFSRSKRVDWRHPLSLIADDVRVRWIQLFSGWRPDVPAVMRAKSVFPLLWLAAAGRLIFVRRGDAVEAGLRRALALFSLVSPVLLAFTDSVHLQIYVVHVIPVGTATLAIAISDFWEDRPALRPWLTAGVAGLAMFGVASIAYRVRRMELQRDYAAVVEAIRGDLDQDAIIVGPSELGFAFGFAAHVRNDPWLASIGDGKTPQYIVTTLENSDLSFPTSATCEGNVARMDSVDYVPLTLPSDVKQYRGYKREASVPPVGQARRLRYCRSAAHTP